MEFDRNLGTDPEKFVLMCLTSSHSCDREDYEFSRMPIATVKPAAQLPERGASAKRPQADQSRRVSLISSSSQEPSAPEKLAAMSSSGNEEPRYQLKSSNVKNADPSIVGRSLLEGNKNHLLSQAKCELMRQEHQVGSLKNCISELQQQACARRLELQDAQLGFIESSTRTSSATRSEALSLKEKVLRDTQIRRCTKWEK